MFKSNAGTAIVNISIPPLRRVGCGDYSSLFDLFNDSSYGTR